MANYSGILRDTIDSFAQYSRLLGGVVRLPTTLAYRIYRFSNNSYEYITRSSPDTTDYVLYYRSFPAIIGGPVTVVFTPYRPDDFTLVGPKFYELANITLNGGDTYPVAILPD